MQVSSPEQLRNLAVVGHNDTGKTTLVSALLYTSGVVNRLNKVEDGHTTTDFDTEEISRGHSIGLAPCFVPWKDTKINLIDTPGMALFMADIKAGLRAADCALMCVDMGSGAQVTTEKVWEFTERLELPVIFNLTRADRENTDFLQTVSSLEALFSRNVLPIQLPIGSEHDITGLVDLVSQKAHTFSADGNGKAKVGAVPEEMAEAVAEWRSKLVEAVAESDEALMEAYFEAGDLTNEQLAEGLRGAIVSRSLFPVTVSAALHGIGNSSLLDTLVASAPLPTDRPYPATDIGGEQIELDKSADAPMSALVFKTTNDPFAGKISLLRVMSGTLASDATVLNTRAEEQERFSNLLLVQGKNGEGTSSLVAGDIGGVAKLKVTSTGDTLCDKDRPVKLEWAQPHVAAIAFAIEPKSKGDEEKIGEAIQKLVEEDPSLVEGRDPQTGEHLLSGTDQLHVEIAVARMHSRYKVDVILHPPKVPYRETIRKKTEAHGRHKKQSGGRGQFADCRITMEPLPRGEKFEFVDEIFGGSIPQNFRPAVRKGIEEVAERGFLAGYPVVDFRVRLQDGQYHDVDSSEMAFKIAGSLAFKDAMENAAPTILEPIMQVEITTTEEFMGDIMSDLSQRRGKPQGMEAKGHDQIVKATVPMAEMLELRPGAALDDPGPVELHHGVLALRRGAEKRPGEDHRRVQARGQGGGVVGSVSGLGLAYSRTPQSAAYSGPSANAAATFASRFCAETGPRSLRSLDAIHLATALSITPEIDALVTYDDRLRDAALESGLQVEAPSKP